MEHLLKTFKKGLSGEDPDVHIAADVSEVDIETIEMFVVFCQDVLRVNAPVGIEYGEEGLTMRMQDNELIPIVHGGGSALDDSAGYSHISQPDKPGKGIEPSQSWGVTGNE